ncbi:OmpA family protein [Sulfurimonas paralvinellae]|uniref:OmpA family protein n=1 Tax=Sulfurimonas paralvinellae TaxID=317658 RepID=A0A7M1BA55_9BACT|nr:OmpA family protein [Sulfurimonas paralvinellae]QOP46599.1 OmpA family protein [Sulfurimonas paralvinellae]
MKRLLLLPALLLGTASFASDAKYEISPMIGYDMVEGNVGIKGDDHFLGGLELQYNYKDSKIAPEISVLYSPNADYDGSGDTSITRTLLNGVYSFDKIGDITPFAKAGLGYEFVGTEVKNYNEDGLVLDAGAGVKVPFAKSWAFKAEALYLAKVSSAHNDNADNNLIAMVGLTYSFGAKAEEAPKEEPKVQEVVEEVAVVAVVAPEVDSDGDGIYDKLDKCPNTPANTTVNAEGCPVSMDDDHDGVLNADDICPNTPAGEAVNSDGCPATVALNINFENNSAAIKADSNARLDKYADFLKKHTNYSAKIVGYTDSRGSESYNKKLSQRRATAVMRALVARGVNPEQLSAVGMGEANPVADNSTAEGRAQNRRIEAELTRK